MQRPTPRLCLALVLAITAGSAFAQSPGQSGQAAGRVPDEAAPQPGHPKAKKPSPPAAQRPAGQSGQAPGNVPPESSTATAKGPARKPGPPSAGRCPGQNGQAPGKVPAESALDCPPAAAAGKSSAP